MNTALQLVHEVEAAGGTIAVNGDKLKLAAPSPLPDTLMSELRLHKAEVMSLVGPGWDAETARIIEWFQSTPAPTEPFDLFPHVKVTGGLHPIFKTKGRACFPIIEHCLK